MNNGLMLLLTFSIPIGIVILYRFMIKNRKKRHLISLDSDLDNFKKAIHNKDVNGINKYGTELIWNENLTGSILENMSNAIDEDYSDDSELENLKNLILNKKLHWNRDYVGTP